MLALSILAEQAARREFAVTGGHTIVFAVSALVSGLCVIFHYDVMSLTSRYLARAKMPRRMRIVALILVMLLAHVIEIWLFGLTYWLLDTRSDCGQLLGPFDEGALDFVYYSATCYTTVGFGDIVPSGPMRILTGTEALVGLSLITWTASLAFLQMQRDWAEFHKS